MFKVIKDFTDLQDNDHIYRAGDPFPREGVEVSEERIKELSTKENKRQEVLIKINKTKASKKQKEPKIEGNEKKLEPKKKKEDD